jgi:hypothetical protein
LFQNSPAPLSPKSNKFNAFPQIEIGFKAIDNEEFESLDKITKLILPRKVFNRYYENIYDNFTKPTSKEEIANIVHLSSNRLDALVQGFAKLGKLSKVHSSQGDLYTLVNKR